MLYRGGFLMSAIAVAVVITAAVHPAQPDRQGLVATPAARPGHRRLRRVPWHWPVFVWFDEQRVRHSGWPLFAIQSAMRLGRARVVPVGRAPDPVRLGLEAPHADLRAHDGGGPRGRARRGDVRGLPDGHRRVRRARRATLDRRRLAPDAGALPRRSPGDRHGRQRVLVFGDSITTTLGAIPDGVYRGTHIDGVSLGLLGVQPAAGEPDRREHDVPAGEARAATVGPRC